MILLYIIIPILTIILALDVLIRIYGPKTSRTVKAGSEYTIKGVRKKIGDFIIHGRIYFMKQRILDDFYDLVKYSDHILNKHGIQYTAAYGTLLGTVRNGGIMPWDDDADFFIHVPLDQYEEKISALKDEIDRDGFTLRKNYDTDYYHVCKKGQKDFFPYIDWYQYKGAYKEEHLYPVKRMSYEDFEVNVPNDPVECINAIFRRNDDRDPMKNIVHDYPLRRYYSLWTVQIIKMNSRIHDFIYWGVKKFINVN